MKYGVDIGIGVFLIGVAMIFWPSEAVTMGHTPAILFGYPVPLIGGVVVMLGFVIIAFTPSVPDKAD